MSEVWPMKLSLILDDTLSDDEKQMVATEFCQANPCCLDKHFSAKLRTFMQARHMLLF